MIKRIITFVLCVALCVSCIAIGVINQKADDASAVAGAIGGAGNGTVDNISADGATTSLLTYNEETKEYELGDDIVINADNAATHATYQALLTLVAQGGVTINGMDKTITTDRPLFESITNVTIKNLKIAGAIVEASNAKIGALARTVTAPLNIRNVTNDADISYVGAPTTAVVGGLIGHIDGVITLAKCVNNGNITIDVDGMDGFLVGGLVGRAPNSSSFSACVNRGNITLGTSFAYSWVGGIIGQGLVNGFTNFWNVLNAGDITVKHSAVNNMIMIGGIIGHQRKNQMRDAINLGDINFEYTGTNAISVNIGGIIGRAHYGIAFTRCINAGDINVTGNVTGGNIGGISPNWYNKGGNSTFNDCISIGTITAPNVGEKAPITPFYHSVSGMYNCYVKAFDGIKNGIGDTGMAVNNSSANGASNNLFVITLPNIDTLLDNIAKNGVTNGAAVFSAILACADYDANYAHDQDDGMFLKTGDVGFGVTPDAERNNYFTTTINKDYLDALKAIAGTDVEIGAIIAPATYVTKIGEFSHDAFDKYYTANKTAIDAKVAAKGHPAISKLYMTAAFGDGADFTDVEGVYNAGIYLKGAYNTAYAARMYVKVADGAYVYSK